MFFTGRDDARPPIQEYGVHIYLEPGFISSEYPYLNGIIRETYSVRVDVIINKHRTRRKLLSEANFVSDIIDTVRDLLLHKTNDNAFIDTSWEPNDIINEGDAQIISGIFTVEIDNQY